MTTAVPEPHTPASESTTPPSRLSRRKLLTRIGCGTLVGGLAVGGGLTWAFCPGGPLSYEARALRALKNDPMGAETILDHKAIETEETKPTEWFSIEDPHISLTRWFQGENGDIASLHKSFVRYAEKNGWAEEADTSSSNVWLARHRNRAADDYMRLTLTANTENDSNIPKERLNTVAVSLDFS